MQFSCLIFNVQQSQLFASQKCVDVLHEEIVYFQVEADKSVCWKSTRKCCFSRQVFVFCIFSEYLHLTTLSNKTQLLGKVSTKTEK